MGNIAYVDGQNLDMATRNDIRPWKIDLSRFMVYLREKYGVDSAYYFVGIFEKKNNGLYRKLERSGFKVVFREHDARQHAVKKRNVDTDVVFHMMRDMHEEDEPKLVLVSGDGDYFKTVKYLIENDRFAKILLPSHRNASSLYKGIADEYRVFMDDDSMRKKFGLNEMGSG